MWAVVCAIVCCCCCRCCDCSFSLLSAGNLCRRRAGSCVESVRLRTAAERRRFHLARNFNSYRWTDDKPMLLPDRPCCCLAVFLLLLLLLLPSLSLLRVAFSDASFRPNRRKTAARTTSGVLMLVAARSVPAAAPLGEQQQRQQRQHNE